jgi:hypothetical protein
MPPTRVIPLHLADYLPCATASRGSQRKSLATPCSTTGAVPRRLPNLPAEVRRASGAWPSAWPSPSGLLAGRGLQGQRRAASASRAAGCEAPLRLEGPARTVRGVPARSCDAFAFAGVRGARDDWPGMRAHRGALRRGAHGGEMRGNGAAGSGPRRCALAQEEAGQAAPTYRPAWIKARETASRPQSKPLPWPDGPTTSGTPACPSG